MDYQNTLCINIGAGLTFINIGGDLINVNTIVQINRVRSDEDEYFDICRNRSSDFRLRKNNEGYNRIKELFSTECINKRPFTDFGDKLINMNTITQIMKSGENEYFYLIWKDELSDPITICKEDKGYDYIKKLFS